MIIFFPSSIAYTSTVGDAIVCPTDTPSRCFELIDARIHLFIDFLFHLNVDAFLIDVKLTKQKRSISLKFSFSNSLVKSF